jgi:hypothetical protein
MLAGPLLCFIAQASGEYLTILLRRSCSNSNGEPDAAGSRR